MPAHEIEYKINGDDMQFVDISLDPGETVTSEPGHMMYMTQGIAVETHLGGPGAGGGLMGKLMSAGKRMLTGESLFLASYTNQGQGKQVAAFAAPFPGKIIPLD